MPKQSRKTKQKEIILKEVQKCKSFFTADDLYEQVSATNPEIGIATIYRFMRDMRDSGLCHSYSCGKKTLYSMSKDNHCHYICTKCGKVSHFHVDQIDFLKKHINGSITHFQIDVYGICEKCSKKH